MEKNYKLMAQSLFKYFKVLEADGLLKKGAIEEHDCRYIVLMMMRDVEVEELKRSFEMASEYGRGN